MLGTFLGTSVGSGNTEMDKTVLALDPQSSGDKRT